MKSPITDDDLYLFNEGSHYRLAGKFGAVLVEDGVWFSVWAPSAARVSVIADFNGWNPGADALSPRNKSGVWEGMVKGAVAGARYKFHIESLNGHRAEKAD